MAAVIPSLVDTGVSGFRSPVGVRGDPGGQKSGTPGRGGSGRSVLFKSCGRKAGDVALPHWPGAVAAPAHGLNLVSNSPDAIFTPRSLTNNTKSR